MALVCERPIPAEWPLLVNEVSGNYLRIFDINNKLQLQAQASYNDVCVM
jgi:hypothetical protein